MSMLSAIIIDDHPAVRLAMSMILKNEGFDIVAESDNGTDAISLTQEHNPSLLLLDINIRKENGLEVIQKINLKKSRSKIVVLTSGETEGIALRCLQAGASGYYPKERELTQFPAFLKVIMDGFTCFPTMMASVSLSPVDYGENVRVPSKLPPSLGTLTNREVMIMMYLANGMSNKSISAKLNISPKTVSTHRVKMMEKINAKSIIEVCYFAKKNNLI